jgi:NAD(P)-dependent dehydrogenase (short-subunit alcohol dehydrogenase family)
VRVQCEGEAVTAGRLAGKVAIISGGATGMGGAASKLFAAEGAKVAIIDRNGDAAGKTVAEIKSAGSTATHFVADVSDGEQVNAAVKGAADAFGPSTVLFNHAGTSS